MVICTFETYSLTLWDTLVLERYRARFASGLSNRNLSRSGGEESYINAWHRRLSLYGDYGSTPLEYWGMHTVCTLVAVLFAHGASDILLLALWCGVSGWFLPCLRFLWPLSAALFYYAEFCLIIALSPILVTVVLTAAPSLLKATMQS